MHDTDVVIIGGGLAGSVAAAMLGEAGVDAILIDPHSAYPADLRCEKVAATQMGILGDNRVARAMMDAARFEGHVWVARFGHLIDRRPSGQYGIMYDDLVNAARGAIPPAIPLLQAKAATIACGADRQQVVLSNGEQVSARLVVMANGLNTGLRHQLGIGHKILSEAHSITIAFDLKPKEGGSFAFPALTYHAEHIGAGMAYLTLFPIPGGMRANLFVYRRLDDPWLRHVRHEPDTALFEIMPRLRRITGDFEVVTPVKIRPVDIYRSEGHLQPGVVLVGDAFGTSCPAAGTGATKVFTDVARLCNVHIPSWLGSNGMGAEKIAAYYDDPVKCACDAASLDKAFTLRATSTKGGLFWLGRRWMHFLGRAGASAWRQMRTPPTVATR